MKSKHKTSIISVDLKRKCQWTLYILSAAYLFVGLYSDAENSALTSLE